MNSSALLIAAIALMSALLCRFYTVLARRWQFLDEPNERSSHVRPTPHGGGIALIAAFTMGLIIAAQMLGPWAPPYVLLGAGAVLLAVLGVVDDLLRLAASLRFCVYGAICLAACILLLRPALPEGLLYAAVLIVGASFAMLWFINLFNFMDGIDGIAALQGIFCCTAAALLSTLNGGSSDYAIFCLLLAAAHSGFLVWNWPPARLFMGDSGSVSTGFLLAGLAVLGAVEGQVSLFSWLILPAVFITDASWTLLWRMATRQPFTEAHRSHAYQRLSRFWGSHGRVDLFLLAINLAWLLPLAFLAQLWPAGGLILVILAYVTLLGGMAKIHRLT
ncbi:MAG: Fuc2NAc and GlcNAc transferase [Halioglobus sp.]|jgi:Fuc2NAc and GlcNAc transferase